MKLEIKPGGPSLNTVTLVASGQDTFGTLAADEVLLANENGANLVIVGVINDISPGGFVALKKSNIQGPRDFPGHSVGVLPFGSTTLLYEAMLAANGVDRKSVREVTVSPDLRPFITGAYDLHPVFVYDETVTLDQQGVQYDLIEPKKFGVQFKGPVYFTSRQVVDQRPEVVEAFVRTMVEGWQYALQNPDEAIRLLKEFAPEIDATRERLVLAKGADYFRAYRAQPVNSDPASWPEMVERLVAFGRLKHTPDLASVVRLEWVNRLYQ
ncbi:MAG: ABC transporter substrate-binding protein [Vicinamibacterales bacterium]